MEVRMEVSSYTVFRLGWVLVMNVIKWFQNLQVKKSARQNMS